MEIACEADALSRSGAESLLQKTEASSKTRYGGGHAAKFPDDPVPLLEGDPMFRSWEVSEDGVETLEPMWWQCDGHCYGVDEPTKDDFLGAPTCVPFLQLLDGCWFLTTFGVVW